MLSPMLSVSATTVNCAVFGRVSQALFSCVVKFSEMIFSATAHVPFADTKINFRKILSSKREVL